MRLPWNCCRHLFLERHKTLKAYQPAKTPLIIVPLGENDGAGQLPLTKRGLVVGAFLAKQIKSKTGSLR